jgi:hypothetical protein
MIQLCCTTALAIRHTQVDEIVVSSRLSQWALIINHTSQIPLLNEQTDDTSTDTVHILWKTDS